ncbi:MAG: nickel pincer cofactor biosynthesis protein LarB [Deltaproteobacteria bacterium]|nr:nickel pincer cofactor biosynthesis protein LarB [Deltaproteobacteria bacterium]
MTKQDLKSLLEEVAQARMSPDQALEQLGRTMGTGIENLGFARLDTSREARTGIEEVIFAPGKTIEQIQRLVGVCMDKMGKVLVTRVQEDIALSIMRNHPVLIHNPIARTLRYAKESKKRGAVISVVSAGTSDQSVAEEAAVTLDHLGYDTIKTADVGVAGLHRLLDVIDDLRSSDALIVVAGMEGALPSVIAGLVTGPVVAVPTSVGYGASFKGIAALLGMLNSCAGGVGVVNIDNGYGAALLVHRIVSGCKKKNRT